MSIRAVWLLSSTVSILDSNGRRDAPVKSQSLRDNYSRASITENPLLGDWIPVCVEKGEDMAERQKRGWIGVMQC